MSNDVTKRRLNAIFYTGVTKQMKKDDLGPSWIGQKPNPQHGKQKTKTKTKQQKKKGEKKKSILPSGF